MSDIRVFFDASDDTMTTCEAAICMLYGKPQHKLVNAIVCDMFGSKSIDPSKLPPCQNAARYHIRRANYQAAIWRRFLIGHPQIPLPQGHRWTVSEDDIDMLWIDVLPAPASVLHFLKRNCKKQCNRDQCSCRKNLLKCIGTCR